MKKHIGLFLFLFVTKTVFAQTKEWLTDSLKREVIHAKSDTARVLLYEKLIWAAPNGKAAVEYGQQGLALARRIRYDRGRILCGNGVGFKLVELDYYRAIPILMETLRLCEVSNNEYERARSLAFLGYAHSKFDFEKALRYYLECKKIVERIHMPERIIPIHSALGYLYKDWGKLDSALVNLQKGYAYAVKTNWTSMANSQFMHFGEVYYKKGQKNLAMAYFRRSIAALKNKPEGQSYQGIALIFRDRNQLDSARFYALEALRILKERKRTIYIGQVATLLYELNKDINPAEALKYHLMATAVNDSLLNQEKVRQAERLYLTEQTRQEKIRQGIEAGKKEYRNQVRIYALLAVLAGVLVLAILFYRNNRRQKQASVLLSRQKQQIESLNKDLERKVDQRTAELKTALIEAQDALLKGQTTERKRVASELHDNLGGLLAAMKMMTNTLDYRDLHPQEREIYEQLVGMVNDANREVRSLSHNLLPEELEKQGLVLSLQNLIGKLNLNGKTRFELRVKGLAERLDRQTEFNLYAICLELCNNILKHAQATEAAVELVQETGLLQCIVSDDGAGFETADGKGGMGLKNLRERSAALGATVTIHSHPGEGTLVHIRVPLVEAIRPDRSVAQT